jgi:ankyrin repeat protein
MLIASCAQIRLSCRINWIEMNKVFIDAILRFPYPASQDSFGRTALHWAAQRGDANAVKALLERSKVYRLVVHNAFKQKHAIYLYHAALVTSCLLQ